MVRLSKQQLVDCSWGSGNHGCKGGHYAAALSWVYVHGISTSKSYGKYLGQVSNWYPLRHFKYLQNFLY